VRACGPLALLLTTWGLVAAPLVHQLAPHQRDQPVLWQPRALPLHAKVPTAPTHHHGAPGAPGQHGEGSLEHGKALLSSPPALPQILLALAEVRHVTPTDPDVPALPTAHRVEMPQGP
jgi:hypothetical protein